MANHAILKARLGNVMKGRVRTRDARRSRPETNHIVVAFQAHREHLRPGQQPRVRTPVRVVARRATLHPNRRMLMHKRSPLIGVAVHARDVVAQPMAHHARRVRASPSRRRRPVRVMAVGAVNRAFVDAVFERQFKARTNVAVAFVTNLTLLVGKQVFEPLGLVDRVATHTRDLTRRMRRTPNLRLRDVLGVTRQATADHFMRLDLGEAKDLRRIAHPLDVQLARPMAALTARLFRGRGLSGNGFEMRVSIETRAKDRDGKLGKRGCQQTC